MLHHSSRAPQDLTWAPTPIGLTFVMRILRLVLVTTLDDILNSVNILGDKIRNHTICIMNEIKNHTTREMNKKLEGGGKSPVKGECYICHKLGHWVPHCPDRKTPRNNNGEI